MSQVAATTFTFDLQRFATTCKIGETEYESLSAAVSAASADATITMLTGETLTDKVTIDKNITLDLNGQTLDLSGKFLYVNDDCKLTIDGTKDNSKVTTSGTFGIYLYEGANLELNGGEYTATGTNNGGFVYLCPPTSNTVTLSEGNGRYSDSFKVSTNPGTITLNNVTATTNTGFFYTPDVNVSNYTFNVTGGTYTSTTTTGSGITVFILAGMQSTFKDVTINSGSLGCVYVSFNARDDITSTSFDLDTPTAEFTNCTFTYNGNTTPSYSWCNTAISVANCGVVKVNSGTYKSVGHVIASFTSGGAFQIEGGTFESTGNDTTNYPAFNIMDDAYNHVDSNSNVLVPKATVNNGTFIGNFGVGNQGQIILNGGRYTEDEIVSMLAENNGYYVKGGDYYYVFKTSGWIENKEESTWLNVSTPASGQEGTLNASLTGSGSTLTLGVAIGIESFTMDVNDISTTNYTVIDASNVTIPVQITSSDDTTKNAVQTILGTTKDDTLIAGTAGATLNGDFGNDSLKGGNGKDTFIYNAGADSINGYTASQGDLVVLEDFKAGDANFTADSSNISLNFGGGDLLVFEDVGDNAISVQSGNDNYVYTKNYVALNDTSVTLAANYSSPVSEVNTFDASETEFETIDASPVTTSGGVYVTGNALDNKIFGGTAGGTLYGNAGNDLLDVNDRNADSKFTFQYTAGKDSVDGFDENNDQLAIDDASNITSAKSSGSKLVFNFSDKANVLTFKGDDIEKVSLQGGGFLTKNGVVTIPEAENAVKSLELFASAKGRIDLTDTPYKDTAITAVNAEKANKQSVTLTGGEQGGAFTFANNKKKDLFEYTGGDVTISNYEAGKDRINLGNYSINGFQIANTNDVSLNLSNGEIMSVVGAAQSEVLIHDANGKSNSYAKMVFAANGVLQNKAKRPTAATVSAGATSYEAGNSIKKIYVTSGVSNIAITAGNNKTTLDASGADGVTLSGGAKNDKLIGNTTKADTFIYSAGKDIIEGYDSSDAISLSDTSLNIGDAKITLSKSSLKLKFSSKNTLTLKNSDLGTVKIGDASYTFGKNAYSTDGGKNVTLTNQFSGTYKIKDDDAGKITAVDGSAVKKNLTFKGTSEAETFTGGTKKTTFKAGGGKDTLIGGTGKDIFFYAKGDTGTSEIQKFDFTADKIKIANGTIKDISTQAGGIQFDMTSGKKGDTATAGSFLLASSIASGASAALDTSKVFIKANNTYYWFADKAGTGDNDKSYAAGDLITASTKVTRAQASTVGYEIIDLGYSTNLVKSTVAVKAGEFTFAKDNITKK